MQALVALVRASSMSLDEAWLRTDTPPPCLCPHCTISTRAIPSGAAC